MDNKIKLTKPYSSYEFVHAKYEKEMLKIPNIISEITV